MLFLVIEFDVNTVLSVQITWSAPAFGFGAGRLSQTTRSSVSLQEPFVIVQRKEFLPLVKPRATSLYNVVINPPVEAKLPVFASHCPVVPIGTTALSCAVSAHIYIVFPAFAVTPLFVIRKVSVSSQDNWLLAVYGAIGPTHSVPLG